MLIKTREGVIKNDCTLFDLLQPTIPGTDIETKDLSYLGIGIGLGAGRGDTIRKLANNTVVPCTFEVSSRGSVSVLNADNTQFAVIPERDSDAFDKALKALEKVAVTEPTAIFTAEDFNDKNVAKTTDSLVKTGTAYHAVNVNNILLKLDFDVSTIGKSSTTKVAASVKNVSATAAYDLSNFEGHNLTEMEKRVAYISEGFKTSKNRMSEKVERNVINRFIKKMEKNFGKNAANPRKLSTFKLIFFNYNNIIPLALIAYLQDVPTLFVGPAGTGKNTIVRQIMNLVGADSSYDLSMSTRTTVEDFVGCQKLRNGEIVFELSGFLTTIRDGGFAVLDEANMSHADEMSVLHSLLETGRRYIDTDAGRVYRHEDSRIYATMNEGYNGTKELNEAFKSRFAIIHVPFSIDPLIKMFQDVCNVSETDAKGFAARYGYIQNNVSSAQPSIPEEALNMRAFIRAASNYSAGFADSVEEAVNEFVIRSCIADGEEAEIIIDHLSVIKT